jgi:hypothetical protein
MSIQSDIQKYIDNGSYISIERDFIDDVDLGMYGFPLAICGNALVVRFTGDFEYNGYRVVSFDDISGINYGETEKFYEKIHHDVAQPKDDLPDFTGAEGMDDILKVLMENDIVTVIECELDEDGYYMGKIEAVDEDTVTIKCFDGCANWFEEPVTVDIGSITMLTFLDRYSTTLAEYAK